MLQAAEHTAVVQLQWCKVQGVMDEEVNCNFTFDKPLSPVLSTGKVSRKFFNNRRVKKSVKKCLTDQLGSANEINNISRTIHQSNGLADIDIFNVTFKRPTAPAPKRSHSHTWQSSSYSKSHDKIQGFQTASGKDIIVPDCNIRQHAELFCDILESSNESTQCQNKFTYLTKAKSKALRELSQKELQENGLFSVSEISDSQLVAAFENITENSIKSECFTEPFNPNLNNSTEQSESSEFFGFTKKDLVIAWDILHKLKSSLYDIKTMDQKSNFVTSNSCSDLVNSSGCISELPKIESESLRPNKIFKCDLEENKVTSCVFGFQTASGNKIHISDKSMEKVSKIFKNELLLDEYMTMPSAICTSNSITTDTTISSRLKDGENCTNKDPANKSDIYQIDTSSSYQNKYLSSYKMSTVTCDTFNNITSSKSLTKFEKSDTRGEVFTTGFTSGSGAKINIKRDSFQRALNLYQNQDAVPSSELLHRSQNKEKPIIQNEFITTGFKGASGVKFDVREDSLQKAVNSFQNKNQEQLDFELNDEVDELFQDFIMLDDTDLPKTEEPRLDNIKSLGTDTDFQVPGNLREHVVTTNNTSVTNKCRKRLGISMACRKQINISENQLEKAKLFFKDTLKCPSPTQSYFSFSS